MLFLESLGQKDQIYKCAYYEGDHNRLCSIRNFAKRSFQNEIVLSVVISMTGTDDCSPPPPLQL